MFFKIPSSSHRFQLKPTKLLAYSLCLLGLFSVVALIVQLRAIELRPQPSPRHLQVDHRQQRLSNLTKIHQALQERPTLVLPVLNSKANETGTREQVVASIDRDDRTRESATTHQPEPLIGLKETQELPKERQGHQDDLVVAPTNEQLLAAADLFASVGNHGAQASHDQEAQIQEPQSSLDELTAAGTAAGLLVQDLVAQANMLNQQFPHPHEEQPQQTSRNEYDSSDANLDQNLAQLAPEQLRQALTTSQQQQQQAQEDDENFGEEADGSPGSAHEPMPMPMPLQAHQTAQQVSPSPDAPEPPDENQMPDSIESLMGVEGSIDAEDGDSSTTTGPQGQQSNLDEGEDNSELQQEQQAGSNLVNQNNLLPLGGFISPQLVSSSAGRIGRDQDKDGDHDEADGRLESAGDINEQALVSNGQSLPLNSADSHRISSLGSEQSLVAPMRDSLVDLNTAADHYYGKKKKKKKIIIKKRKKMKYKKIKIVKTKKKKKVKKHHKKKHQHKKRDHGKYYM